MRLTELLKSLNYVLDGNCEAAKDVEITGICPNSSRVEPGNLYIAIEGLHADGHAYIPEAIRKGAVAAVVSRRAVDEGRVDMGNGDFHFIVCDNTRRIMSYLFAAWYSEPQASLKMIGVTGTNGKTSVSRLIYEILTSSGKKCALIGTTGCRTHLREIAIRSRNPEANMTTPDPEELYAILAAAADDGCEYAIMEVTSHALVFDKVAPITFDVSVFTNLTEDHLDLHESMENYFAAKSKLFDQSRYAVINYDDRYGRLLADNISIPATLCTAECRDTGCAAEDIHLYGERGIEYKLTHPNLRLRVRSPLAGKFNVMNTMQAALVARRLGVSAKDIKDGLAHFSGIDGRLQRLRPRETVNFNVYVDYAHTPDALENLLRAVKGFVTPDQRIVLIFGCGGDRDRGKRPHMGKIAVEMADFVIITADNSRSERTSDIIGDILSGISGCCGAAYTVIEDRRSAIEYAIKNAREGDVILLAGKGHEEYEITSDGKRRFCEREIVTELITKYYG